MKPDGGFVLLSRYIVLLRYYLPKKVAVDFSCDPSPPKKIKGPLFFEDPYFGFARAD